ncbi:MAG: hypothetical protein WAN23_09565 [Candidatus Acidiferrales bacterium]
MNSNRGFLFLRVANSRGRHLRCNFVNVGRQSPIVSTSATAPATTQKTLRHLRLVYGALIVSIALYLWIVRLIPARPSARLDPLVAVVLGIFAVAYLGSAQTIRSRRLRIAFDTLRAKPDDPKSLAGWRAGAFISAALAEGVALLGLVIHFLGGNILEVIPFFVAGAAAMIVWWPKTP